ncbi:3-oxoacyl-[acyl-carrier-protein] synthase III C-terminal domain-containing protein [Amycolatopsis sp. QT-25]|uniref:type III polyketide synthase n=1 Tax=Amycolatopsis sp. QT-25 TaxID=3034022 RepID=UPI0023ED1D0B|nr:3-oxoacyl-[acyl-carrier-protein] synthase III C-terminal domain-containing protein [Amycolatopsis sp. QT-25]WET76440.1 3-oxoacyl-[acyl-carrier-protein] synthase III C-terminal domain-containing protein [Amycolatopsis sp. QT-25]
MTEVTTISAVHGVLPPHRYPQAQLTELFGRLCLPDSAARAVANRFHTSARVSTRHLAMPIENYENLDNFTAANDAFLSVAVDLGCEAALAALDDAGLAPSDVDLVVSTTVTGIAVPSLDARIASRIGMRSDVKRIPIVGLGCLAGAAGIARLHDYLRGWPTSVAMLISVELCSLTVQRGDASAANMIASGLFGDGAAAVVAVGDRHRAARTGPRVVDSVSHLYENSERAMGWDIGSTGLKVVLGAEVPELVHKYLAGDVEHLLARHGLDIGDVARWICHPGGPKVIEAIQTVLGLDEDDLAMTWSSLDRIGNLSSASVLHVFADTVADRPASAGDWGVVMAMGPGFCAELVLLQW